LFQVNSPTAAGFAAECIRQGKRLLLVLPISMSESKTTFR
jgi:cysteine synthase